jgi:hypothetical protein
MLKWTRLAGGLDNTPIRRSSRLVGRNFIARQWLNQWPRTQVHTPSEGPIVHNIKSLIILLRLSCVRDLKPLGVGAACACLLAGILPFPCLLRGTFTLSRSSVVP